MGAKFRKSVSLGKGARINFSKSGASLSLGRPGASVGVGKRGAYANLGISGTGLSMRTKLSASSSKTHSSSKFSNVSSIASKAVNPDREYALAVLEAHSKDGNDARLKAGGF